MLPPDSLSQLLNKTVTNKQDQININGCDGILTSCDNLLLPLLNLCLNIKGYITYLFLYDKVATLFSFEIMFLQQ